MIWQIYWQKKCLETGNHHFQAEQIEPFFLVSMYLCKNAALGQVFTNYLALLWLEDGQSLSRGTIRSIPSSRRIWLLTLSISQCMIANTLEGN